MLYVINAITIESKITDDAFEILEISFDNDLAEDVNDDD